MGRDFYCAFPYDLPSLPAIKRLRRGPQGLKALLAYYELRMAVGQGYQYGQHVTVEDVEAMAPDWGLRDSDVGGLLQRLADAGLVDAELLGDGVVGMADVAERQQYLMKRAEAGKRGMERRWGKKEPGVGADADAGDGKTR